MLERAPLRDYWLLFGEETFLVERALQLVLRRCRDEGKVSSWRTLWAHEDGDRLGNAIDDLTSPLLFGGSSGLVVRHVEALTESTQEAVLSRLDAVGHGGRLILVGGAVDARRRLPGACQRAGAAFAFAPQTDGATVRRWVGQLARERGHAIASAAVDELLDRVGMSLGALDMELEKLSLHAGPGREISVTAVQAVVGSTRARGVEELTDRIGRGDLGGALFTFRQLMADGEAPIRILAFLASNLRRALHVAELSGQGLRPEEIGRRIGMPPWLVQKQMGRGSAPHLRRALRQLRTVDLELKRSRPAEAVFERALFGVVPVGSRTS